MKKTNMYFTQVIKIFFFFAIALCQVTTTAVFAAKTKAQAVKAVVVTPISTCQDLQNIDHDLTASYVLTQDIDCSETAEWNDGEGFLAMADGNNESFQGTLDGNGFTISNLKIGRLDTTFFAAIFHNVGSAGKILNLKIKDIEVNGRYFASSIASVFAGTMDNVSVSGHITSQEPAGGLVVSAFYLSHIKNSRFEGDVRGKDYVGGISSALLEGTYENLHFKGNVYGEKSVGGITGYTWGIPSTAVVMNNVYSVGTLTSANTAGGLVGEVIGQTIINNSFSAMDMNYQANFSIGGLVGNGNNYVTVNQSYWDKDISGVNFSSGSSSDAGKSTQELHMMASFEGWDFENIWQICEAQSYPHLYNEGFSCTTGECSGDGLTNLTNDFEFPQTLTDISGDNIVWYDLRDRNVYLKQGDHDPIAITNQNFLLQQVHKIVVSDDLVVMQGLGKLSQTRDIYVYDLYHPVINGELVSVGFSPDVHDRRIAFYNSLNGSEDVYTCDLNSDRHCNFEKIQKLPQTSLVRNPNISQNYISWSGLSTVGEFAHNIYVHDFRTGVTEEIPIGSPSVLTFKMIATDDTLLFAWVEKVNGTEESIVLYNHTIGEKMVIDTDPTGTTSGIDDLTKDYVIWTNRKDVMPEYVGLASDIYVHYIKNNKTRRVDRACDVPMMVFGGRVDDNRLVFVNDYAKNSDIYLYEINQAPEIEPIADLTVRAGEAFEVAIYANDPEGLALSFDARTASGESVGEFEQRGDAMIFQWVADLSAGAEQRITIIAKDKAGLKASVAFKLFVDPDAPIIYAVTPAFGQAGDVVTITGKGFGSLTASENRYWSNPGSDINNDQKVSISDLSLFAQDYRHELGNIMNPRTDINNDGQVSVADLSLLSLNYGSSSLNKKIELNGVNAKVVSWEEEKIVVEVPHRTALEGSVVFMNEHGSAAHPFFISGSRFTGVIRDVSKSAKLGEGPGAPMIQIKVQEVDWQTLEPVGDVIETVTTNKNGYFQTSSLLFGKTYRLTPADVEHFHYVSYENTGQNFYTISHSPQVAQESIDFNLYQIEYPLSGNVFDVTDSGELGQGPGVAEFSINIQRVDDVSGEPFGDVMTVVTDQDGHYQTPYLHIGNTYRFTPQDVPGFSWVHPENSSAYFTINFHNLDILNESIDLNVVREMHAGPTWFVDAVHGEDAQGRGAEDRPLASIQAAVDAAQDGHVIYVAAGEYQPVSIFEKSNLQIFGNEQAVIKGSPEQVALKIDSASGITINQLRLMESQKGLALNHVFGSTFVNLHIEGNNVGVELNSSEHNALRGSLLTHNLYPLAVLDESVDNDVENNRIEANGHGVLLDNIARLTFRNNMLVGNNRDTNPDNNIVDAGIIMHLVYESHFTNNHIEDHNIGMDVKKSEHNVINENVFIRNKIPLFIAEESVDNSVEDNRIEANGNGVLLDNIARLTFRNNVLVGNNLDANPEGNNYQAALKMNMVYESHFIGNHIEDHNIGIDVSKSERNVISNNMFTYNLYPFVMVEANDTVFSGNELIDNANGLLMSGSTRLSVVDNVIHNIVVTNPEDIEDQIAGLSLQEISDSEFLRNEINGHFYGMILNRFENNEVAFNAFESLTQCIDIGDQVSNNNIHDNTGCDVTQ